MRVALLRLQHYSSYHLHRKLTLIMSIYTPRRPTKSSLFLKQRCQMRLNHSRQIRCIMLHNSIKCNSSQPVRVKLQPSPGNRVFVFLCLSLCSRQSLARMMMVSELTWSPCRSIYYSNSSPSASQERTNCFRCYFQSRGPTFRWWCLRAGYTWHWDIPPAVFALPRPLYSNVISQQQPRCRRW